MGEGENQPSKSIISPTPGEYFGFYGTAGPAIDNIVVDDVEIPPPTTTDTTPTDTDLPPDNTGLILIGAVAIVAVVVVIIVIMKIRK